MGSLIRNNDVTLPSSRCEHSRPDQATIHDTDKIHAEQYSIFPAGHPCAARTRAEHQYRQGSWDIRLCSIIGLQRVRSQLLSGRGTHIDQLGKHPRPGALFAPSECSGAVVRASGTAEHIFFGVPNLLLGGLVSLRGEVGKQIGSAVFDGDVTTPLGRIGGSKRRQLYDQGSAAVKYTGDTVSDDTRKTYTRAGCASP